MMSPRSRFIWLAALSAACHRPPEPGTAAAPQPPPAAAAAAKAHDEGEDRAEAAGAHTVGTPGPALVLTTIDGEKIDLARAYGGKPVYLKFWATWCIPCREQMPGFEHIYETLGDRMTVIAVNTGVDDDTASVQAFRKQYGLHMPVVVDDGRLSAALDLQVTPQHVLIGRDARIAFVGHHDGERLDAAIQQALAAPPPAAAAAGQAVALRPAFRPGDAVRDLDARLGDGTVVPVGQSRDHRPRGVVLFSLWCESYLAKTVPKTSQDCRRVREQIDQLIARGDIDWLGIAHNLWTSSDDIPGYQKKTGTRLPIAFDADGSLFRAFGVHQTPTIALIDPDGRLVRIIGPDETDLAAATRAIAAKH